MPAANANGKPMIEEEKKKGPNKIMVSDYKPE